MFTPDTNEALRANDLHVKSIQRLDRQSCGTNNKNYAARIERLGHLMRKFKNVNFGGYSCHVNQSGACSSSDVITNGGRKSEKTMEDIFIVVVCGYPELYDTTSYFYKNRITFIHVIRVWCERTFRLATIKGNSKMCSFTVLGGSGGSENQSVSGVTTICLTQCNTSPSHRVDQIVDCGLWNVGPLLFNGCVKLLDIGRNWNMLSHAEHPKHAQRVTCPVNILAMQELGCFQLPGIVYRFLQHGAMHYHAAT